MGDTVIPQPLRAWNSNGRPSAGARATFFLSGTTTPATVYSDYAETTPHPSPLIADSAGAFPPIYRSGVALKCVLTDANLAALPGSPIDPVPIVRELGASASEVTFAASIMLPYTDVQTAIDGGIGGIVGGTIPFSGPIMGPSGSAANPAFTYELDPDTGAFRPGADQWAVSTGGVTRVTVSSAEFASSVPLRVSTGSAGAPAFSSSTYPNSGIFFTAAGTIISALGTGVAAFTLTETTFTIPIRAALGSLSSVTYGFDGDPDNGIYSPGANQLSLVTAGVDRLAISAAGAVTASGNFSAANVLSGTYTPTLTSVTNVDATTANPCQYMRVGSVVTVSGSLAVDATAAATNTEVGISLPIASNFTGGQELGGTAVNNLGAYGESGAITADATNDRARLLFKPSLTSNQSLSFHFTYRII